MKLIYDNPAPLDYKTALWVSFWLVVLTAGNPDILDATVALIGRVG